MRAKQLFIVRVALIAGVGAFAALAAYQRYRMDRASFDFTSTGAPLSLDLLRYMLWGLALVAFGSAIFLRSRVEVARPAQRGAMLVIGWALGEGVALFGTVQHFIGAQLSTMAIGLLTFVVVLIILPIPAERT